MTPAPMVGAGSGGQYNTKENPFHGNTLQNSISAVSDLSAAFWSSFHTFGVDWSPGESLRWYIDGTLVRQSQGPALWVAPFCLSQGPALWAG